ncbi:MAG: lytic transglycosylase domain-containing protein [Hyphomicrobiales bacterium]|nr:lytic transglycosylase domain-containing protein [Hyphomicrobiales bacterium]
MSELRAISALSRAIGLAGVFGLGALSHWSYSQFKAPGPEYGIASGGRQPAPASAPGANIPTGDDVLKASVSAGSFAQVEVWRAKNAQDGGLARRFSEARAAQVKTRLDVLTSRQISFIGRQTPLPAPVHLPSVVRAPGRFVVRMAGPVELPAAVSLPQALVAAGTLATVVRKINAASAASLPAVLDHDRMMLAVLRSQLQMSRRGRLAREHRLEEKLQQATKRALQLAEREIIRAAAVKAPSLSSRTTVVAANGPVTDVRAGGGDFAIRAINQAARAAKPAVVTHLTALAYAAVAGKAPAGNAVDRTAVGSISGYAAGVGAAGVGAAAARSSAAVKQASLKMGVATDSPIAPTAPPPVQEAFDLHGVREAIAAFKKGDMDNGRAHAKSVRGAVAQAAVAWAEVSLQPRKAGSAKIIAFLEKHPGWPMRRWLEWRTEQGLFVDKSSRRIASTYLAKHVPASPIGQLVLARQLLAKGHKAAASQVVSQAWRTGSFSTWLERMFVKEFRGYLSTADLKYRSDKQFYKERYKAALRIAGLAGKDAYKLAAASVAVARGGSPEKFGAKLTSAMRRDPVWIFANIVRLRRAGKVEAAAHLFAGSKISVEGQVDPASWWMERRMVARRLLDDGKAKPAYEVAAGHALSAGRKASDAEFYAGWLALRFLKKAEVAQRHFERSLANAKRPGERSRGAYWLGRAVEKGAKPADAEQFYGMAARNTSTYYGQLARARMLGTTALPIRQAPAVVQGADRHLAVRTVDLLMRAGEDSLALRLAFGLGKKLEDRNQIAALAAILRRERNASGSLVVGKLAARRGIQLDDVAFPSFGIPDYVALANSADRSMVYAIARQESAFRAKAKSHAGARGLMQMLVSTARVTARRKGIPFDADRLISDPAFNAQLGAAHLGDLMEEHPGSLTLVFAAYNAGGPRVKQWIRTYGDPRKPGVDPIDWVERIPIAETRHYVQRVTENLGVYRSMLGNAGPPHPAASEFRTASAN